MGEWAVLDLFSGLGGFSAAFRDSDEWGVTTVELSDRFSPDMQADVFDLQPSDFAQDFDVVLASPPCTQFSFAASSLERFVDGEPQTDDAADAVALVYHTIGLIRGLSPEYWFLENPQGWLRQVIGRPDATLTFCQYGEDWMKPTDIWGTHPAAWTPKTCTVGNGCHVHNTDQAHGGLGNCDASGTQDAAERAKIPYPLSEELRDVCERSLRGEAQEQTGIGDW